MEEGNFEREDRRFGDRGGFGERRPSRKSFGPIPVKEGDTYDVEIEGIGDKGDGIAKVQGYVIVVPNVKKGDRVKVKINAVRGKVSFGEVVGEAEKTESKEDEEAAALTEESDEEPGEESESEEDLSQDTDTKEEEKE